jgi:predicted nucleotide-binding protein/DNA-binding response OmpR family regulator
VKARFLLITDLSKESWLNVIQEALTPLGDVEVEGENRAVSLIQKGRYRAIIIDATHTKDASRLLVRIRKEYRNIKVVVATASPDWREARQVFRLGAIDYIYRSMTVDDLRSRFRLIVQEIFQPPIRLDLKEETALQKATILFADNARAFVNTRKRFLEKAGYKVICAYTPDEAKRVLNEENIDLAILDLRMVDNQDEKDVSGILVAKLAGRYVPKIILTLYPSVSTAVEAMKPSLRGLPPAVNYIGKEEGHERLLQAVEEALKLRVFIVHGRDNDAKESVARFIENLGLWAIILHEQAGGGRTIIEKFEGHSGVGFAIVILTPDDVGGLQGQTKRLRGRARQNVVFELGYFIGKLGRGKVAVLHKKGVEMPSDYIGIECLPMDRGGSWKEALKKEILKAGINVDLSLAR